MLLPTIILMPSVNTSYTANSNVYTSNTNGYIFNVLVADFPALTAQGGVTIAPRNNVAASAPTVSNDYTELYGVGSLWEDTATAVLYMCTVMGSSPGAATWTTIAAASGTLTGTGSSVVVLPTGASNTRSLANLFADQYNNVKTFGAVGNGSTDDTAAINATITEAASNGSPVYFPPGTYKVTSGIVIDFTSLGIKSKGITIVGAGMSLSTIDGSGTGGFTTLLLEASGGTAPGSRESVFNVSIRGLGIKGSYASGAVFQIGLTDTSDAFNSCECYEVNVNNINTSGSAIGTQINFVLTSNFFDLESNCAGHGIALDLNSTQFCNFLSGSFSTADIGVHITNRNANAYTFANVFSATDIENVSNCVVADQNTGEGHNVFMSGTFVWNILNNGSYCIVSSASSGAPLTPPDTLFYNPNFAPDNGSGALYGGLVLDPSNYHGVQIFGLNYGDGTTPAGGNPVSGTTYTNNTGQSQVVTTYGNVSFTVQINPAQSGPMIACTATGGTGVTVGTETLTVVIKPGYSIAVTYSGAAPTWLWLPLGV